MTSSEAQYVTSLIELIERFIRYHDGQTVIGSGESIEECSCSVCCDAREVLGLDEK